MKSLFDALNPEAIIQFGGLTLLLLIVFAESGLFYGFFLPGDSLLFIAGLLSDSPYIGISLYLLILLLIGSGTLGSLVGFFTGRWSRRYFLRLKNNFFFKQRYLEISSNFYRRHGIMAFVMGRFLPIIRTFVPIMAGMVRIDLSKFLLFNVTGVTVWVLTMVLSGHWLGNSFPSLIEYVEVIMVWMILMSGIPVLLTWFRKTNTLKISIAAREKKAQ